MLSFSGGACERERNMGCDITAYIEYSTSTDDDGTRWFNDFASIPINRNYLLFALMAGVRNRHEIEPVRERKGLPSNVSEVVLVECCLLINEGESTIYNVCTPEEAERLLKNGASKYIRDDLITNPDYHSYSWLSIQELEEVQRRFINYTQSEPDLILEAAIAAMKVLDRDGTGCSRLVFWFDS